MVKRLVVYSISDEATRLAFEGAIDELDSSSCIIIPDHCIGFRSDKNLIDLIKIIPGIGLDSGDIARFVSISGESAGFGSDEEVSAFMKS